MGGGGFETSGKEGGGEETCSTIGWAGSRSSMAVCVQVMYQLERVERGGRLGGREGWGEGGREKGKE